MTTPTQEASAPRPASATRRARRSVQFGSQTDEARRKKNFGLKAFPHLSLSASLIPLGKTPQYSVDRPDLAPGDPRVPRSEFERKKLIDIKNVAKSFESNISCAIHESFPVGGRDCKS